MALIDNLVAYWRLEEASGARGDSIGGNVLTDNNTVTQEVGKLGHAAQFTRANSEYLSITDNTALSMGDIDFSIALWVYLGSKPTVANIYSKETSGSDFEYGLYYYQPDDRFYFWVGDSVGGYTQVAANNLGAPSTATWYLIVGYHDSVNNVIGISGNAGTPNTASHTTGVRDSGGAFRIGTNRSLSDFFDGRLDAMGVWKKVLTSDERSQLYNSGNGLEFPFEKLSIPYPYILRDKAPTKARYRATLYSPQGYPQAIITGYSQLSYTLTTSSDGGGFSIALPPTIDRSLLKMGSFVTIDRTLDGGIPHFEDVYIVLSTPEAQARKGTRFPTIEGPSVTGYLTGKNFRAVGQLESTIGSFVTSTPADNAVKYFVSRNMAKGAENNTFGDTTDRRGRDLSRYIGFTVEKDKSLGPRISYEASLKPLDVVIRDIAKLSREDAAKPARLFWYIKPKTFNPLSFEFITMTARLPSKVYPKLQRGAFNVYRGFDSASPIILGPAFGTVIETDQETDYREGHNSVITTYNTKTALTRITDRTRAWEFPFGFREVLDDAEDSGTEAAAEAEVRGRLNEGRPRLVTRLKVVDSLSTVYGRDYFLGDIVGCLVLDRRYEAEISGVEVNVTRDGDAVTIKTEEITPFTH